MEIATRLKPKTTFPLIVGLKAKSPFRKVLKGSDYVLEGVKLFQKFSDGVRGKAPRSPSVYVRHHYDLAGLIVDGNTGASAVRAFSVADKPLGVAV